MSDTGSAGEKICFVIAPIGGEGSETRRRSDLALEHIIKPAASRCGYVAVRSDKISQPGMITLQVIQHLLDDPLVIADLTDRNPNVYYELAIRHFTRKAVIQIILSQEDLPFDVSPMRTIYIELKEPESTTRGIDEIEKQINSLAQSGGQITNPISIVQDLKSVKAGEVSQKYSAEELMGRIRDLGLAINSFEERARELKTPSARFQDLVGQWQPGLADSALTYTNAVVTDLLASFPQSTGLQSFINSINTDNISQRVAQFKTYSSAFKVEIYTEIANRVILFYLRNKQIPKELFEFAEQALLIEDDQEARLKLFEVVFNLVYKSGVDADSTEGLLRVIGKLSMLPYIKKWISSDNRLLFVISTLGKSPHWSTGAKNMRIILNLGDEMTNEELNKVVDAADSQDQVYGSPDAKPILLDFLQRYGGRISADRLEKIRRRRRP